MDAHENARTTPHSRRLIVERLQQGQSVAQVALALGSTSKTVRKWRDRHAAEGPCGLRDRSSRPHHSPIRLSVEQSAAVEALRRLGLSRLAAIEPRLPVLRYEREHPGELIHIDIKKLGRIEGIGHRITGDRTRQSNRRSTGKGLGWEFVHVAIDDTSRLAYTELLPSGRTDCVLDFTRRAIAWLRPRRPRRAGHDRQWIGVQKLRLPRSVGKPGYPTQANQALHPAHQRKGRALHPDIPAGMGLCPALPELR